MTGERRIASDTGPLITLEKLSNGYRFIRLLYDKILIPRVVLEELVQGQFLDSRAYIEHYGIADLLHFVDVQGDRESGESFWIPGSSRPLNWPWKQACPS